GKYFFQFGITISVAVGLSYIEAITLTPMRTSKFMEETTRETKLGKFVDRVFDKLVDFYSRALDLSLKHRAILLIGSAIFFAATFALVKFIPKEFVPVQDISSFMIRVKTPDGSSLEYTDKATKEVEDYLLEQKD